MNNLKKKIRIDETLMNFFIVCFFNKLLFIDK